MKHLWKFLLMLLLAAPVWAGTTALTGTILDASNNPAINGFVRFTVQPLLPNVVYRDTGTGLIIRTSSTCNIQSDGTILDVDNVAACTISDNNTLTPANSFYKIEVAPGGVVSDTFFAFVTGASADISSLTLASPSSALPPPSFAVATNPTVVGILTVENIVPKADSTYDLGTTTIRFKTLFVDVITGASVAQSGACATNLYVIAVNDGSAPTCLQPDFTQIQGVATDAQINDNITLTNLTQVITRLISDTTGTLAFGRGGTGQTTAPDDNVLIGSGSAWALFVMPNCTDNVNEKLNYDAATNAFECNSDQGAGAGGITTLNTLIASSQTFVVGTAGTDFVITSATSIHTFDMPSASATARGLVTNAAQTFGGTKTTTVWNASTGFQIGGGAALGNVLRGNATNFVSAQLNFSDLAGAATDAQVPDTITLTNLTQVTTRNFTAMQGTVTDIQLANNYSGVGACAANTFASTLNDNAAPTCTQPSFSNLSGTATDAQVSNTITLNNLTQITTRNFTAMQGTVTQAQIAANSVGASELDDGECVDGQIWQRVGGSWVCGTNVGGAGLGFTISGSATTFNPADSTIYFFGSMYESPGTTADLRRVYIPKAGTMTRWDLFIHTGGVNTTSTATYVLRLNNTSDSHNLSCAYNPDSNHCTATGSVAVVAGDYIEVKLTTPAFPTNPTTVRHAFVVYIE